MFKKILLLSALFGLLFFGMAGECFADVSAQFEQAKDYRKSGYYEPAREIYQDIIQNYPGTDYAAKAQVYLVTMNISAGRIGEAQEALDKLVADFNDHPRLPEALFYGIARVYAKSGKYEEAKTVCRQIIQQYPDSSFAGRAQLSIPAIDVLSLAESGNDGQAQEALDKLVADFNNHPDLPEVLSHIAGRYKDLEKYQKAESICKHIIQNYPDTDYVLPAQRELALWYISVGRDDEAQTAIDSLITYFGYHPGLPEALYSIARRYEEAVKNEKAESMLKDIIQNYPGTDYALLAQRDLALWYVSEGRNVEAQTAIDRLIIDSNGHPDSEALYSVAGGYEGSGKYEEAKSIYQQILLLYPGSTYAGKAQIAVPRIDVLSLIDLGKDAEAQAALEKLIADFNDHPDLADAIFLAGQGYYKKARLNESEGLDKQAKDCFRKTIGVWERTITELPPSAAYTPAAYFRVAVIYSQELGEYQKGIDYYNIVVNDWPDHERTGYAWFLVGRYYEKLKNAGSLSESEANLLIEQAYKAVVEEYSDSPLVKDACWKLGRLNLKAGQWIEAAVYFELFLQKAPEDPRAHRVMYDLGRAYEKMVQIDMAIVAYKEFINTAEPNDPLVERIKARLEKLEVITK